MLHAHSFIHSSRCIILAVIIIITIIIIIIIIMKCPYIPVFSFALINICLYTIPPSIFLRPPSGLP